MKTIEVNLSKNTPSYLLLAVNEFWVSVQRTEASDRCGLTGSYWLKAENDILILKDPKTKRKILVWPYKLLRRYGRDRVGDEYRQRKFVEFNLSPDCNDWS